MYLHPVTQRTFARYLACTDVAASGGEPIQTGRIPASALYTAKVAHQRPQSIQSLTTLQTAFRKEETPLTARLRWVVQPHKTRHSAYVTAIATTVKHVQKKGLGTK